MNKRLPRTVGTLVAGTCCAASVTAVNELEDADALALSVCTLSTTVCRGYGVYKLRVSKSRDE